MNNQIRTIQQSLHHAGFNPGTIDGIWGPQSQAALDAALAAATGRNAQGIAWSAKVSPEFEKRVIHMAEQLRMPPAGADWLMACMAWESGRTFSPDVRNMAGSGATGLIQFMPATARGLGTSTDALARMTAIEQMEYVYAYFKPYAGRLNSLGDVYMAILWPAGIGKPLDWTLWDNDGRPTTYRQNAGLDINKDGVITKGEAVSKVQATLEEGYKHRRSV